MSVQISGVLSSAATIDDDLEASSSFEIARWREYFRWSFLTLVGCTDLFLTDP